MLISYSLLKEKVSSYDFVYFSNKISSLSAVMTVPLGLRLNAV